MREAQSRMKSYYDKNRRAQVFSVGDEVLLNATNIDLKLHPVFHTSLLKLYESDACKQQTAPVLLADGVTEGQLVRAIINHRRRRGKLDISCGGLLSRSRKQRGNLLIISTSYLVSLISTGSHAARQSKPFLQGRSCDAIRVALHSSSKNQ
ncbi:TPA: hypothetical protein N0F65_011699 [Lagenidium giganteum]|uniref:Uncharacterized protein n=1 Tax=Lagenidium giganteum TaxID=4803 RepID=A0AAV2YX84_9STRA|nr:TPA: hypothetical protein N0F65_011699 [Lagenidium giganteum]